MQKFVNNVGTYLIDRHALQRDDLDVFAYGLDLMLFSLLSVLGLLSLGLLTGHFRETVFCLAVFVPMQTTGGGYHAKTHIRCFFTMVTGWIVAMMLCHILPLWATIIFMAQGIAAVLMYAPIEHVNAPMSDRQKNKMRVFARSVCILSALAVCGLYATQPPASAALAIGLGMTGISMRVACHMKRNQNNP